MNLRSFAAATLLALPASTLLVGCDRKPEDSAAQRTVEQRALERDLDLALRPDSATTTPVALNDVPAPADTPSATLPALAPPPPAAEPERAPPPPVQRPRPQPRAPEPRPAPAAPAEPAPSGPQYVTRTAVAGQMFNVSFDQGVSARQDGVGSTFTATLSEALVDDLGRTVIPAGATVSGRVTGAERGHLGVEFTSLSYAGERYSLDATVVTGPLTRQVNLDSRGERVAKVAAPAAAGAVVGRVIGGNRRGAVVGAIVGAAAGAAASRASADVDTVVDPGATATIRLEGPISVRRRVE